MVSDATTFFLSFASVFLGLGYYLWRLEQKVNALERKLATIPKNNGGNKES